MPPNSTDPVDWKIDRTTWDVVFPLQRTRGAEAVAQRIAIKMKLIRGELFTNRDAGMPWFEGNGVDPNVVILGNPFNEELAKSEARKIITSIDGAGKILKLTASFNSTTRKMLITWRVSTEFADIVGPDIDDQVEVDL